MSATPRLRRAALTAAALALASGAIELLALGAHGVVFGELLSFEAAQNARLSLIPLEQVPLGSPGRARDGQAPAEDDENNAQALHPYVGYVLDPNRSPNWPVNEYGFLGAGPPFGEDDAGAISIAIVGGSVAENLALFAQAALVAELAAIEAFRGRKLRVSCLALRGMKQPQQLLVIDWFLSLGARFDIVINLDGFNEVVLSGENALQGTFPFYPRRWRVRMQGLPDLQLAALAGEIRFLDELRAGLAQRFVGAPQRWSVTANVVWRLADRRLRSERDTVSAALNRRLLEDTTPAADDAYQTDGPKRSYADAAARHSDLARYWARASRLLQQRAERRHVYELHGLRRRRYHGHVYRGTGRADAGRS